MNEGAFYNWLDDYKTQGNEAEAVVICTCKECGEPIFEGDDYYEIYSEEYICEECISKFRKEARRD